MSNFPEVRGEQLSIDPLPLIYPNPLSQKNTIDSLEDSIHVLYASQCGDVGVSTEFPNNGAVAGLDDGVLSCVL